MLQLRCMEFSFDLLHPNFIVQEPNNLFILENHISSSIVFSTNLQNLQAKIFALIGLDEQKCPIAGGGRNLGTAATKNNDGEAGDAWKHCYADSYI